MKLIKYETFLNEVLQIQTAAQQYLEQKSDITWNSSVVQK